MSDSCPSPSLVVVLKMAARRSARIRQSGSPLYELDQYNDAAEHLLPRAEKRAHTELKAGEGQSVTDEDDSEIEAPVRKRGLAYRRRRRRDSDGQRDNGNQARKMPLALTLDESSDESSEDVKPHFILDSDNDTSALTPATRATPPRPQRLAYLTVKGIDGDNFTIPVSQPLLARIPAYSARLDAARRRQSTAGPAPRISITDATKWDFEDLTAVFDFLAYGTLPVLAPTMASLRDLRDLLGAAHKLQLSDFATALVDALTRLRVPDARTFVLLAGEIFGAQDGPGKRKKAASDGDFGGCVRVRRWADVWLSGHLDVLAGDEGLLRQVLRAGGWVAERLTLMLAERHVQRVEARGRSGGV